jgi:hypothetical protein
MSPTSGRVWQVQTHSISDYRDSFEAIRTNHPFVIAGGIS